MAAQAGRVQEASDSSSAAESSLARLPMRAQTESDDDFI
jgi:hypothetical protein